ncbi:50S rRNA methyltransferase [Pokkaliibacter plantistimulans]|uniref:Ribosomal RNA large subunit methyltransferase H n=2 Tax=Pseudomonadota TaxID=1224 RepID=A0ABX5LY05_9GAMM|nr:MULTISPECIES: 23S rRNA (pseudouridine(1915)-N(3))-methyltransferase RlmH [Pokkaliibacter]MDH2431873.1 23S rRNA (pseudouridine(1915)-N(3))-methyltransferase RlmH [Pokkaliibacter sp. MBI-7]PPC79003.1 23S rRNA (pseudouridine(1915)-N(3))-methyltransferase RlmH [Pokkaliibacter plantistimulans]PXF30368.1 50S rRNA methyltransferase [Pokkaliibacter plantistimulans]
MKIRLLAVGSKMPGWVEQGYQEYAKRLPAEMSLELIELPMGHRGKNADLVRAIRQEGDAMLAAIGAQDRVIALDVKGKPWSTEDLAQQLSDWRMEGVNISLLVGGPDGLDSRCLQRADAKWSLSALTLPHPLVRVVLAEQLYRAWTILQGHPYHK